MLLPPFSNLLPYVIRKYKMALFNNQPLAPVGLVCGATVVLSKSTICLRAIKEYNLMHIYSEESPFALNGAYSVHEINT